MSTETPQDGDLEKVGKLSRRGFSFVYNDFIIPIIKVPSRPGHNLLLDVGIWEIEIPLTSWAPGIINFLTNWAHRNLD